MTTTGEAIEHLLEVQAHDTHLDQIRHRLEVLPERVDRDERRATLADLEARVQARKDERDDLARRQKRLDDEVETIDAKRKAHDATLYGGTVTNARELQDLQEEIESLGRRIDDLEEQELELMEQIEPIDADLNRLMADRDQHLVDLDTAEARLTAAEAEVHVELDDAQAARDREAEHVPAELLAEYDSLRRGGGGVGIARLVGGNQCGGCHLTLSAVEVAAMRKHPDEVTHCEECGRLLVP